MHPVIIEAIAARQIRDSQAQAAAAGRARQARHARRRPPIPVLASRRSLRFSRHVRAIDHAA